MKFRFIKSHQRQFGVRRMCQVLEVSSSGFYAWLKRAVSQRERDNEVLLRRIRDIFENSRQRYGSPRIHAELWSAGWPQAGCEFDAAGWHPCAAQTRL